MASAEDTYLNRAKFVMEHLGVWIPPENETVLRKIYRIFMIALQYLFLVFQMIYIVQVWGDLDAVSQASYLLFTQACLCLKVTVFLINMDKLKELLVLMNAEIFKPQNARQDKKGYSRTNPEHQAIVEKCREFNIPMALCFIYYAKAVDCVQWNTMFEILREMGAPEHHIASRIKRLLLAFMISSQITCGLWALKPLFDDAGSRKFPFDMWMPITTERSPQYHIGYVFQLATICISAYMYFGVDSVAFSSVIFGCAQLDIVKDKLMNIAPLIGKRGNEVVQTLSDNYDKLVQCIKHHQAIVTFTELVENAYHTYLLFQLIGSVGIICMSALRILVVDWRSMQFFSILTYLSVMISQLFVCCWCGHELTATSEDLHTVLYECVWFEQDVKFKRELCFAMMRMSRPLVLRAGRYITLSRQTFVSILRMSYSYFAVLNQANKT